MFSKQRSAIRSSANSNTWSNIVSKSLSTAIASCLNEEIFLFNTKLVRNYIEPERNPLKYIDGWFLTFCLLSTNRFQFSSSSFVQQFGSFECFSFFGPFG